MQPERSSVRSQRLRRAEFRPPGSLPVFPVLYRQCGQGIIPQGQLLFPSLEAVDSLNK
jgi:hypothetical protein